jgi:hypothetical protein
MESVDSILINYLIGLELLLAKIVMNNIWPFQKKIMVIIYRAKFILAILERDTFWLCTHMAFRSSSRLLYVFAIWRIISRILKHKIPNIRAGQTAEIPTRWLCDASIMQAEPLFSKWKIPIAYGSSHPSANFLSFDDLIGQISSMTEILQSKESRIEELHQKIDILQTDLD